MYHYMIILHSCTYLTGTTDKADNNCRTLLMYFLPTYVYLALYFSRTRNIINGPSPLQKYIKIVNNVNLNYSPLCRMEIRYKYFLLHTGTNTRTVTTWFNIRPCYSYIAILSNFF